ncbi:hypothetical protein AVEN_233103-1 [Araneus ventricosus]|uniref:PiggyBac transposable element-derived protein domain-containing protein n=1 Tax=Araneus ventricosus TaxID=182803 RepID=A0A4Y2PC55_ARAVE|nr:hypothetical protein AVEN_233103-1 [Araneus ventricosus]
MEEFRGAFDYRYNEINGIFGLVWKHNRHKHIKSFGSGKRWSRTAKKQVLIPKPDAIANYNKNMGGVDKLVWKIQKYRTKIRGKKWYFPIHGIGENRNQVNAHTIYCIANRKYHY